MWCTELDATRRPSPDSAPVLQSLANCGFQLFAQHLPTRSCGAIIGWVLMRHCVVRDLVVHAPTAHRCSSVPCPFLDSDHFALEVVARFPSTVVVATCAARPPPPSLRFSPDGWDGVYALVDWAAPAEAHLSEMLGGLWRRVLELSAVLTPARLQSSVADLLHVALAQRRRLATAGGLAQPPPRKRPAKLRWWPPALKAFSPDLRVILLLDLPSNSAGPALPTASVPLEGHMGWNGQLL